MPELGRYELKRPLSGSSRLLRCWRASAENGDVFIRAREDYAAEAGVLQEALDRARAALRDRKAHEESIAKLSSVSLAPTGGDLDGPRPYLIYPLCEPLTSRLVRADVASTPALAAAAEAIIVFQQDTGRSHGNIKPSNILFHGDHVLLADASRDAPASDQCDREALAEIIARAALGRDQKTDLEPSWEKDQPWEGSTAPAKRLCEAARDLSGGTLAWQELPDALRRCNRHAPLKIGARSAIIASLILISAGLVWQFTPLLGAGREHPYKDVPISDGWKQFAEWHIRIANHKNYEDVKKYEDVHSDALHEAFMGLNDYQAWDLVEHLEVETDDELLSLQPWQLNTVDPGRWKQAQKCQQDVQAALDDWPPLKDAREIRKTLADWGWTRDSVDGPRHLPGDLLAALAAVKWAFSLPTSEHDNPRLKTRDIQNSEISSKLVECLNTLYTKAGAKRTTLDDAITSVDQLKQLDQRMAELAEEFDLIERTSLHTLAEDHINQKVSEQRGTEEAIRAFETASTSISRQYDDLEALLRELHRRYAEFNGLDTTLNTILPSQNATERLRHDVRTLQRQLHTEKKNLTDIYKNVAAADKWTSLIDYINTPPLNAVDNIAGFERALDNIRFGEDDLKTFIESQKAISSEWLFEGVAAVYERFLDRIMEESDTTASARREKIETMEGELESIIDTLQGSLTRVDKTDHPDIYRHLHDYAHWIGEKAAEARRTSSGNTGEAQLGRGADELTSFDELTDSVHSTLDAISMLRDNLRKAEPLKQGRLDKLQRPSQKINASTFGDQHETLQELDKAIDDEAQPTLDAFKRLEELLEADTRDAVVLDDSEAESVTAAFRATALDMLARREPRLNFSSQDSDIKDIQQPLQLEQEFIETISETAQPEQVEKARHTGLLAAFDALSLDNQVTLCEYLLSPGSEDDSVEAWRQVWSSKEAIKESAGDHNHEPLRRALTLAQARIASRDEQGTPDKDDLARAIDNILNVISDDRLQQSAENARYELDKQSIGLPPDKVGPARVGWTAKIEDNGQRIVYSPPTDWPETTPSEIVFYRVEVGDESVCILDREVTIGLVDAVLRHYSDGDRETLTIDDVALHPRKRNSDGLQAWSRRGRAHDPGIMPGGSKDDWFSNDQRRMGLNLPGEPRANNMYPIQNIRADEALAIAVMLGCRLPKPEEWREATQSAIAMNEDEENFADNENKVIEKSIRDERSDGDKLSTLAGSWATQLGYNKINDFPQPDNDDNTFFRPASPDMVLQDLRGNVAEWVIKDTENGLEQGLQEFKNKGWEAVLTNIFDNDHYFKRYQPLELLDPTFVPLDVVKIAGGSALTPPGDINKFRPTQPADGWPQEKEAAFTDVGFRLAFRAARSGARAAARTLAQAVNDYVDRQVPDAPEPVAVSEK